MWHPQVSNDKIRRPSLHFLECLFAVVRRSYGIALGRKRRLEYTRDLCLVVHYKNVSLSVQAGHIVTSFPGSRCERPQAERLEGICVSPKGRNTFSSPSVLIYQR